MTGKLPQEPERDVVTMVRPTLSVVPDPAGVSDLADVAQDHFDQSSLTYWTGDSGWTVKAVCAAVDPDTLFVTGAAQREAARLCQACPVRLECLADALDNRIEYGVWGGLTERQRRAVLKRSPGVASWRTLLEEARASATSEAAC